MPENNNGPEEFIAAQTAAGADPAVAAFIADFLYVRGPDHADAIGSAFRAGYCYYFAHMLALAFRRGQVCWAAPYGHFVWLDDKDGYPYDAEGLYSGEAEAFVPERYLGGALDDFLHVRGKAHDTSEQEIQAILDRYLEDTGKTRKGGSL